MLRIYDVIFSLLGLIITLPIFYYFFYFLFIKKALLFLSRKESWLQK